MRLSLKCLWTTLWVANAIGSVSGDAEATETVLSQEFKDWALEQEPVYSPNLKDIPWGVAPSPRTEGGSANALPVEGLRTWIGEKYDARWPNAEVPLKISDDFSHSDRIILAQSIATIESISCIEFIDWREKPDYYVYVQNSRSGCWANVGYLRDYYADYQLKVNLGRGCVYTNVIIHELFHILGAFHEQSRPDRDLYLKVNWDDIRRSTWPNFFKHAASEQVANSSMSCYEAKTTEELNNCTTGMVSAGFGTCYDYYSIMHYSLYSFGYWGRQTLEPLDPHVQFTGSKTPTETDIYQLNSAYKCYKQLATLEKPKCHPVPEKHPLKFLTKNRYTYEFRRREGECVRVESDNFPSPIPNKPDTSFWKFTGSYYSCYGGYWNIGIRFPKEHFCLPDCNEASLFITRGENKTTLCGYGVRAPKKSLIYRNITSWTDTVQMVFRVKSNSRSAKGFRAHVCAACIMPTTTTTSTTTTTTTTTTSSTKNSTNITSEAATTTESTWQNLTTTTQD